MFRIILVLAILLAPLAASADELTKTQYFVKYGTHIPRALIAQRMEQMYDLLDTAGKAQARTVLLGDLQLVLGNNIAVHTANMIAPLEKDLADVNDTTLPD
jgi:hypothetical protein